MAGRRPRRRHPLRFPRCCTLALLLTPPTTPQLQPQQALQQARPRATFECDVPLAPPQRVELHWLASGQRKLKHTFTRQGERFTSRTAPGHVFGATLEDTAGGAAGVSLGRYTIGAESGAVHYIRAPPGGAGSGDEAPRPRAERPLNAAEKEALAVAAAEAAAVRRAPRRPASVLPTADDPIPPILPAARDGNGQEPRYGVGDEGNWRPDGERAKLVTKQPGLVRALTEAGFATRAIPPGCGQELSCVGSGWRTRRLRGPTAQTGATVASRSTTLARRGAGVGARAGSDRGHFEAGHDAAHLEFESPLWHSGRGRQGPTGVMAATRASDGGRSAARAS